MGKIVDFIVNDYNSKTDKDNNIAFLESYIDYYRQHLRFFRSHPRVIPTPQELVMTVYFNKLLTPTPYIILFLVLRGIKWYVLHGLQ